MMMYLYHASAIDGLVADAKTGAMMPEACVQASSEWKLQRAPETKFIGVVEEKCRYTKLLLLDGCEGDETPQSVVYMAQQMDTVESVEDK